MALIQMFVVGLVIGFIARAIMPGTQKLGWIMTAILGIVGSALANFVGGAMHFYEPGQTAGWIASVIGAIVLLAVVGKLSNKG
ncbi:GlsB/YeaQ/YmgE family stress response membrane protein [Lautropia mirabilis]|uniref:GlsB/YeaQ/YmgE family stress response membrane protein n=1 Tax=Lautropia mirabilis TaxID=47671 RepID=UPI0028E244BC|nr:GlsB/YeaQ/YmgE family stress response membrane protein [Lautropia mirabilis]